MKVGYVSLSERPWLNGTPLAYPSFDLIMKTGVKMTSQIVSPERPTRPTPAADWETVRLTGSPDLDSLEKPSQS